MKLALLPLLTDENIDPDVVSGLRARGHSVQTALELQLGGSTDRDLLRLAKTTGRVVLTHDADFGALAIRDGEPFIGIVFLRPGHVSAEKILAVFDSVANLEIESETPFIVVAERREDEIRIRVRLVL